MAICRNGIQIGQRVQVDVQGGTNNPAAKLNGNVYTVKSKLSPAIYRGINAKAQYTLYGDETKHGLPYWFLEEDLVVL